MTLLLPILRGEELQLLSDHARWLWPDRERVLLPFIQPPPESRLRTLAPTGADPAGAILSAAAQINAAAIVMASAADRPRWTWFRPLVEEVLRRAPMPVLICKLPPEPPEEADRVHQPLGRILVPLDGSVSADSVLPHVVELARAHRAEVSLLHVEEIHRPTLCRIDEELLEELAEALGDSEVDPSELARLRYPARALERLRTRHEHLLSAGVAARTEVALGDPVDQINERAAEVDLLVLSRSGLRLDGDQHWFGSVAKHVLRSTLTPLFLCPAGASSRFPVATSLGSRSEGGG